MEEGRDDAKRFSVDVADVELVNDDDDMEERLTKEDGFDVMGLVMSPGPSIAKGSNEKWNALKLGWNGWRWDGG
jgi:hypothetical protein